ncbi:MAG TPA: helix-turn-helix transcriptional regulator [Hyphomicrobiaceae bacterium]|nr:helix-turn-helix transcriptional regulator [Hyphomicrobiaceae bacterium]
MSTSQDPDLMTVTEVADYLRVRERTIYELVRTQRIPSCKLSGKLLFPKRLIELWVAQSADYPQAATHLAAPPPVIAGSHDPLLEWSSRESKCGLAMLVDGSTGGMHRLLAGQASACGLHLIDPATGNYDAGMLARSLPGLDFVVIEWARRRQGLIVAPGNPAKIGSVADLRRRGVRVATRQEGSGSALLFAKLLADAGLEADEIKVAGRPVSSETDIAVAVREGKADAGLAIEAVAREQGLDFVPLQWERFDLVVRRVEYFEEPLQRLFAFARTDAFRERAASLGGYDVANTGAVVFNARR